MTQVRDEGSLTESLSPRIRQMALRYVEQMDPAKKTIIQKADPELIRWHPLIVLLSGVESQDALFRVASQGMASRELVFIHAETKTDTLSKELLPSIRKLALSAASAYVRNTLKNALKSSRPLGAEDAERLEVVGRVLADESLRRTAAEHQAKTESSARAHLTATYYAARAIDLASVREHLAQVPAGDDRNRLFRARIDKLIRHAERVELARNAKGDLLDAAVSAALLDRFDDASAFLNKSGVQPKQDLRAALTQFMVQTRASLCDDLDRSDPGLGLCAASWEINEKPQQLIETLRSAWATGKGRDSWTVEAFVGISFVLPGLYKFASGSGAAESASKLLGGLVTEVRNTLGNAPELPAEKREAILLFSDVVVSTYKALENNSSGLLRLPEQQRREFRQKAEGVMSKKSNDPWGAQAILATALVLASSEDTRDLLDGVPRHPDVGRVLAMAYSSHALRQHLPERIKKGREMLMTTRPEDTTIQRWRCQILSEELNNATNASRPSLELLLNFLQGELPPDVEDIDKFHYAIDLIGVLARLERWQDAENIGEQATARLLSAPPTSETRDLHAALVSAMAAVRARSNNLGERRDVARQIEQRLFTANSHIPEESLYYEALLLKVLLEKDERSACAKNDKSCQSAVDAKLTKIDEKMASLRSNMNPTNPGLIMDSVLPLGGSAGFGINYSLEGGISLSVDATARMPLMPPLPSIRR